MKTEIDPDIVALFDGFARCDAPVGNYYGTPTLVRFQGRWYLALGTSNGSAFTAVSDAFAAAWIDEFDVHEKRAVYVKEYLLCTAAAPWPDADSVGDFDAELDDPERARLLDVLVSTLGQVPP